MHLVSRHTFKYFFNEFFLTGRVTSYSGWVGLTPKKSDWVIGQPVFASGKKKGVWVRYFLGRVKKL